MKQFFLHRKSRPLTKQTPKQEKEQRFLDSQGFISEVKHLEDWIRSGKFAVVAFSLAVLFSATGCLEEYFVNGNHSPATEERYARNFNEITSGGEFIVDVVQGDEYSVRVTAESNLLAYIETDVVNHTLRIRTRDIYNLHNHQPMTVEVVCPGLDGLRMSGSGSITAGYFATGNFDVAVSGSGKITVDVDADRIEGNISGSGDIILTGTASETDFNISGSGKIHSYDLVQEYCRAGISGSGSMYVNVSRTLDVTISGSGKVFYINNPSVHTKISGSGAVVNRN
ncbi:MAG: head GIN domain-containing protein [Prolixibacteraceae bacterium]|jgi:hypothetical protein|nr:head GIN domain-containing protein [Prolixibacteraceae bacterium]